MRAYLNSNVTKNFLVSSKCGNGFASSCKTKFKYDASGADDGESPAYDLELTKIDGTNSENKFITNPLVKGKDVYDHVYLGFNGG